MNDGYPLKAAISKSESDRRVNQRRNFASFLIKTASIFSSYNLYPIVFMASV